jgi:hypothetical protein
MPPPRLSESLLHDGTLSAAVLETAAARQAVYGGALDTALLELEALDEPTLWAALSSATGVPTPDPVLLESPDPTAAGSFDAGWSRRCHAVPVSERNGILQLLCSEPIEEAALEAACAALGVAAEIYVVPEVRLAAARQAVYGDPVPPRLLRLLARLVGPQAVRRWLETQRPAAPVAPASPPEPDGEAAAPAVEAAEPDGDVSGPVTEVTTAVPESVPAATEVEASVPVFPASSPTPVGRALAAAEISATVLVHAGEVRAEPTEEQLCRQALDPDAETRLPALRALRGSLGHPRVRALTEKLRRDLAGIPSGRPCWPRARWPNSPTPTGSRR